MFKYFVRYSYEYYKGRTETGSSNYFQESSSIILVSETEFNDICEVQTKLKSVLYDTSNTYFDIITMNRL